MGSPCTPPSPGGGLIVNSFVQVSPSFVDRHSGAVVPHLPSKSVSANVGPIQLQSNSMLTSPRSQRYRRSLTPESVLFTTASTTIMEVITGASALGAATGRKSRELQAVNSCWYPAVQLMRSYGRLGVWGEASHSEERQCRLAKRKVIGFLPRFPPLLFVASAAASNTAASATMAPGFSSLITETSANLTYGKMTWLQHK